MTEIDEIEQEIEILLCKNLNLDHSEDFTLNVAKAIKKKSRIRIGVIGIGWALGILCVLPAISIPSGIQSIESRLLEALEFVSNQD